MPGMCVINGRVGFVDKEADAEQGKTGREHEIILDPASNNHGNFRYGMEGSD